MGIVFRITNARITRFCNSVKLMVHNTVITIMTMTMKYFYFDRKAV